MSNTEKCAELFQMLCKQSDLVNGLGKKVTQKMFYFFERKGLKLNLRYGIHFYGPYSSKLDNVMHLLESEDILSIDYSGVKHIISMGSEEVTSNELDDSERRIANEVIDTFFCRTASDLEALATMDFISHSILGESATRSDVINKFKEIKGNKFSDDTVERSFDELVKLGYIKAA